MTSPTGSLLRHPGRRRSLALAATAAAVGPLGGCASRELVAAPGGSPGPGTWAAVGVAFVLAALVIGVLATAPAWRRSGGARLAMAVLTVQTGAVAVGGAVLVGMAVRTWQLLDRPVERAPARSLVRLSSIDGDTAFFALMVLTTVLLTALVGVLLALATRLAAADGRLERYLACVVLVVEIGACGFGAALYLLGARGWLYLGPVAALPVLLAALVTCWPPRHP